MKKNNVIKDKKVLSALTIGISAMMFLQTPISAYAAENDENNNDEPITIDKAETEAAEANNACMNGSENAEGTAEQLKGAQEESQEAASLIVNGGTVDDDKVESADEAFSGYESADKAAEAVENLVKAAENVLNDDVNKTEEGNVEGQAEGNTGDKAEGNAEGNADDKAEGKAEDAPKVSNLQSAAADISDGTDSSSDETAMGYLMAAGEAETAGEEAYSKAVAAVKDAGVIMGTTENDKAPGLIKTQENIDKIVDDTNTKGQEIVDKIANAQSPEEIAAAKGELDKLINDSKEDLESQISLFTGLSDSFDKAVDELKAAQDALDDAEDDYQGALNKADAKTTAAQNKVNVASQKVEKLAEAMDEALDAIDGLEAEGLAGKRGDNWSGKFGGNNIADTRDIMKKVIEDYYLTEILHIDLVKDADHPVKFKNPNNSSGNYERNYTTVTYYYNEDGVVKEGTKYFNWDSIAKTDKEHQNLYIRDQAEAATGIVIYEKDEAEANPEKVREEISSEILRAHSKDPNYFRRGAFMLDNKDNIDRGRAQGMFRLYSYIDASGNEKRITQFELFGGNPGDLFPELLDSNKKYKDQGNVTEEKNGNPSVFTKTVLENGNIGYINPWTGVTFEGLREITLDELVVQNKNGLYRDANCLILGDTDVITAVLTKDTDEGYGFVYNNVVKEYNISPEKITELIEANARFNRYIDNSTAGIKDLKDKYNTYATEVAEAQKAVENAQTQVSELSDAIDALRNKSVKKSKTMYAKDALEVDDIATYFGLTGLDKAKAAELNNLTLVELINRLGELKKEAKDKVDKAETRLNMAIDELIANADSAAVRPSGGGDTPSTGGEDTPEAGGDTTPDTPATPAAPAAGGAIAAATTNPSPSAAPVLAAVEAAMAADAGAGQANPAAQAIADFAAGQADQGGAGNVEIADGDVALAETPDAAPVVEETDETLSNVADIEDPAVALASGTTVNDEARKMNWWWILIVALLGVTGKKMYEEHMRKEEEKNKNKID